MVEGDAPLTSNKWEEVKQKGDANILKWIQDSLIGKSCLVVLIGEKTSERKWCNKEIEEAWRAGKGIVGIFIHNLKHLFGNQSKNGHNPFKAFYIDKTYTYITKRDIFMYGSDKVFRAFNNWLVNTNNANQSRRLDAYLKFILCIREDICGKTRLTEDDVLLNLLQNEKEIKKLKEMMNSQKGQN